MDHVDTFSLSLGALVAFTLTLFILSVVLLVVFRASASFLQRFQSIGAERVNGKVQVRGLFEQEREPERREEVIFNSSPLITIGEDLKPENVERAIKADIDRTMKRVRTDDPS